MSVPSHLFYSSHNEGLCETSLSLLLILLLLLLLFVSVAIIIFICEFTITYRALFYYVLEYEAFLGSVTLLMSTVDNL